MTGPPPPQRVPADVADARRQAGDVRALLEATIARAASLTEDGRHRRVNNEWSTIESIRHIVFVVDVWLSKAIKGEDDPFHPTGIPPHFVPRVLPGSSIDADANPKFEEACEVLRGRLATLDEYLDALGPEELAREIGTHAENVAGGLGVIFDELTFHNHFINRDLDVIEAGS